MKRYNINGIEYVDYDDHLSCMAEKDREIGELKEKLDLANRRLGELAHKPAAVEFCSGCVELKRKLAVFEGCPKLKLRNDVLSFSTNDEYGVFMDWCKSVAVRMIAQARGE